MTPASRGARRSADPRDPQRRRPRRRPRTGRPDRRRRSRRTSSSPRSSMRVPPRRPWSSPTGSTPTPRTATGRSSSMRRSTWVRARGGSAALPQLTFPWPATRPARRRRGADRRRCRVAPALRRPGRVAARRGPGRIGVVGHDFGGMHAILLATVDRRPAAYVLIAPVPRWGDWFLPFWPIEEDRIDYLRAIRPLDPIEHIGKVDTGEACCCSSAGATSSSPR